MLLSTQALSPVGWGRHVSQEVRHRKHLDFCWQWRASYNCGCDWIKYGYFKYLLLCSKLQLGIIHILNAEVLENAVYYFFTQNGPKKLSSNSPNPLLGTLREWHDAIIVLVSAC